MTTLDSDPDAPWCPIYKWGQRRDKIYITVFVPCLHEDAVKVELSHNAIDFRAERIAQLAGSNDKHRNYLLHLDLLADIDEHASQYFLRHDHVRLELVKRRPVPWRTLQLAHIPKNKNERPDFDHVGDDDSDDEILCRDVPTPTKRSPSGSTPAPKRTAPSQAEQWAASVSHRLVNPYAGTPHAVCPATLSHCSRGYFF